MLIALTSIQRIWDISEKLPFFNKNILYIL